MATRAGQNRRGFTLIELVLVLLIIALVAALAYPTLRKTGRRMGVRSANYELLSLLRQARWWSSSTGRTCLVNLRPTEGGYVADVSYLEAPQHTPRPLQAEWARLEQLPAVKVMMKIPPDRGVSRRKELTVRFTPWGVDEDYVIALAEAPGEEVSERDGSRLGPQRGMRIEVRRPSGLIWLLPGDSAGALGGESLSDVEEYWRVNCRNAGR